MKVLYKRLLLLLIIVAAVILIQYSGLRGIFTYENFKIYKDHIAELVSGHYLLSVIIYTAGYIIMTALSIPGAALLTLAGGYFFGLVGIIYVNIGATCGAAGAFLASRFIIGSWVQEKYALRLESFNRETAAHGYNYLLMLRFIPVFPFFLINLLAGITSIPLSTFVWTTSVGIIPGSFAYIYAGTQAGIIQEPKDILSWKFISALILLALISLIPVIIKKFKKSS